MAKSSSIQDQIVPAMEVIMFRLEVPMVDTTTYGLHSLQYTAAIIWNHIPDSNKMNDNLTIYI